MRMRRILVLLISICCIVQMLSAEQPMLIPACRSYTAQQGSFVLSEKSCIAYADEALRPVAEYLASMLHIGVVHSATNAQIMLNINPLLAAEEYELSVDAEKVTITGGDYGGIFCGVTTLLQLLPSEVYSGSLNLPQEIACCTILDKPRFEHRGFMLDVCRTWVSKEAVIDLVDLLAYYKINCLRLHLTDDEAWRIEIKSHPELAEVGGFRGGDSPIWPRYGKWNEKWGGYYSQQDMREIIEYAAVRNIEVVPEIDLPGHSLCIATIHPEILCDYKPNTSAAFGYDNRTAFCPTKEANYELLEDILSEICGLFPSSYIHIGGDEVDKSQWRKCPDCQRFMRERGMKSEAELQEYFMTRVANIVASYGKQSAVWNEAIDGGNLSLDTRVYGWEGIKECRQAAAAGYPTVIIPGQYFYFDMKQSPREPGHDWAAIFDVSKVYGFSPEGVGFTSDELQNVVGVEATFFSEAYASRNPENSDYLHYQLFPRVLALAEVAWVDAVERDWEEFKLRMIAEYDDLDAMGVAYRLYPPQVKYEGGVLTASVEDGSEIYYRREPMDVEMLYTSPITTTTPAEYVFIARRGEARSTEAAVDKYFRTITPAFVITSSMGDSESFSFAKAQNYGRLARTNRAAGVGDWVQFTFESAVSCRSMKVATGNFQLPRYIFENGYVEVSYDGATFERVGDLECGMFIIEYPMHPIKAVRITSTSEGNGARWVSIQPPTILPKLW